MPQIASTHDKKPVEQLKAGANRAADIARDVADKSQNVTHEAVEATTALVERTAGRSLAAAEEMVREFPSLATSTAEPGSSGSSFWLDLVKAQMAQNLDAFCQMMTARTAQERMSVQSSYISGNIARMAEVASRCMQLTVAMAARLPTTGSGETSKSR